MAFGGVVEAGDELDDGGFALSVFADEGNALAGGEGEAEVSENGAVGAGVGEGDVAELEAALDGLGRGQAVGVGAYRRLHVEEGDEVGEEECLVGDAGAVEKTCWRLELACWMAAVRKVK